MFLHHSAFFRKLLFLICAKALQSNYAKMGALTGTYLELHHICKQMLFCGLETLTSFFFFPPAVYQDLPFVHFLDTVRSLCISLSKTSLFSLVFVPDIAKTTQIHLDEPFHFWIYFYLFILIHGISRLLLCKSSSQKEMRLILCLNSSKNKLI